MFSRILRPAAFVAGLSILLLTACNSGDQPAQPGSSESGAEAAARPKALTYSIVASYPHDTSFYTQGLEFHDGKMYEGTGSGSYAGSFLLQVDLKTGKASRRIALAKEYFGEGITILRDTIYQLTWQNKKAFSYHLADFKKIAEFNLGTEGWGLTNNGSELIASDGTSKIYYYEPGTFRLLRTQTITEAGSLSYNLNELEYAEGFLYANQYQSPYIFRIDPGPGTIVAKADLTELWNRARSLNPGCDVPNGIAYDNEKKSFYITGKLWPELYEVKFGQ